jgi:hypothetical protein
MCSSGQKIQYPIQTPSEVTPFRDSRLNQVVRIVTTWLQRVASPLKDYLRKEYETWLLSENFRLTPSGKLKGTSSSEHREICLGCLGEDRRRNSGRVVEEILYC